MRKIWSVLFLLLFVFFCASPTAALNKTDFEGKWFRTGGHSAEITISNVNNGSFEFYFYGDDSNISDVFHFGEWNGTALFTVENKAVYEYDEYETVKIEFIINNGKLQVSASENQHLLGDFGAGIHIDGEYEKRSLPANTKTNAVNEPPRGKEHAFTKADFQGYWAAFGDDKDFLHGYLFSEAGKEMYDGLYFNNWEGAWAVKDYEIVESNNGPVLKITQKLIGEDDEYDDILYFIQSFSEDRFIAEIDGYTRTFIRQTKIEPYDSPERYYITDLNGNISMYVAGNPVQRGVVLGDRVRMRADSNTSAAIMHQLNKDTTLDVLKSYLAPNEKYPWYQVNYEGDTGWVYGEFLKVIQAP